MFKFPKIFGDKYENYIVVSALKHFASNTEGIDCKSEDNRNELIEKLEEYANQSSECAEHVKTWADETIKEGIKDVYIRYIDTTKKMPQIDLDALYQDLDALIYDVNNKHYFGMEGNYESDLKLVKYDLRQEQELTLHCYFFKYITVLNKAMSPKSTIYPIMVDVYFEDGVIISRAKSKDNMYVYNVDNDDVYLSTNVKKELKEATEWVAKLLNLTICKRTEALSRFKRQLYYLLLKYTDTPKKIQELMAAKQTERNHIIDFLKNDVCDIGETFNESICFDVDNMIEKYFSIAYTDKNIFTRGKDAYPLKLISSDEEDSKVQQSSAENQPLQSRSVFFDNKKMIQQNQSCDGMRFMFERKNPKYMHKYFPVRLEANDNYCLVKFFEYVREEDIDYVLFSIIRAKPKL